MTFKKITGMVFLAGFVVLMASCGGADYLVKDPNVMLTYLKESTPESMDNLAKAYSSTINKNRRSNKTYPGLFSDYAVVLAQQGKAAEANVWFNKEMDAFPVTRTYVMQLKRQLVPQFLNDTSSTFMSDTLNIYQADELTPQRRAAAEERAATVLESSDQQIDDATPAKEEETQIDDSANDEAIEATDENDESAVEEPAQE